MTGEEEVEEPEGGLTLKKQSSQGVQSIMRVFQRLELSTEQIWLDFSRQYSSIDSSNMQQDSNDAIKSLKDKYLSDQEA